VSVSPVIEGQSGSFIAIEMTETGILDQLSILKPHICSNKMKNKRK